ncbi:MAG: hypothetical protein HKN50_10085 [Gammaproteobacteria bacterium]|nr:hypothetical protein [Gammaproteobacteria bacterium]
MRSVILLSCLLGMQFVSLSARAEAPSFSYLSAEYVASGDFEVSDGDLSLALDMDGFALNASLQLGFVFVQASRFELESEELFDSRIKDSISSVALGFTFALPKTALYALIRGRNDDLQIRGGLLNDEVDGSSLGGEVGARVNLTDRLEINAKLGRPSADAGNSYGLGAQFFVTENIGLTLDINSLEIEDGDISASFDTTAVGLRYTF